MKILLFGATGTVGRGVLKQCLAAPDVDEVLAVTRRDLGFTHPRLRQLLHDDFMDYSSVANQLVGYDGCFWCLGRTSSALKGPEYIRVTRDYTLAAARTLAAQDPELRFCFISAVDAGPNARLRAAQVKYETEQELMKIFPRTTHVLRPAHVQPVDLDDLDRYSLGYRVATRLFPMLDRLLPRYTTTAERLGRVMLDITRDGSPHQVIEGLALH